MFSGLVVAEMYATVLNRLQKRATTRKVVVVINMVGIHNLVVCYLDHWTLHCVASTLALPIDVQTIICGTGLMLGFSKTMLRK